MTKMELLEKNSNEIEEIEFGNYGQSEAFHEMDCEESCDGEYDSINHESEEHLGLEIV